MKLKPALFAGSLALALAILAVPGPAAAAQQECPAAPWRRMPLASKPAEVKVLKDLLSDFANFQPYVRTVVPHVIGALVGLAITLILLVSFIIWRIVNCFACCQRRQNGKQARKLLAGRATLLLKAVMVGAATGALVASVVGITKVDTSLVDGGLKAIDAVTAVIDTALDAGQDTVGAVQAMDTQLLAIKTKLQGMGPMAAALVAPYIQAIDQTHSQLGGFTSFSSDLSSIRSSTVDKIQSAIDDHTSLARTADKWRANALYIAYSVLAGLAVVVAIGALVDWPAVVKPFVLLLLILLLITWVLVVVLTALLRVGNDVCVNVEPMAQELTISFGGSGSGSSSALITYYLEGAGGGVLEVLNSTMGLDVPASMAQAEATLQDLQQAIDSNPALSGAVGSDFDTVQLLFGNVSSSIDVLVAALSYSSFQTGWSAAKGFICCDVLNSVGTSWAVLIAVATCGVCLMFLVFMWIGRMDHLHSKGCCHIYSQRDYTLEGDGHDDGSGGLVPLPGKKKAAAGEFDALQCPPSPTIMARKDALPASPGTGTPPWAGKVKASQVVPASSDSQGPSSSGLYPSVHRGNGPPAVHPAPGAKAGPSRVPNDEELRLEAERAAQLAGQAYAMASQAQSLLDVVARTTSRISNSGHGRPGGSVPTSPTVSSPSAYGSVYSGSPGSPSAYSPGYNGSPTSPPAARGADGSYPSFQPPVFPSPGPH